MGPLILVLLCYYMPKEVALYFLHYLHRERMNTFKDVHICAETYYLHASEVLTVSIQILWVYSLGVSKL